MARETIEIQKTLLSEGGKVGKYQDLVVGGKGFFRLVKYELIMRMMGIPGAFGLLMRKKFYPKLLGDVGKNVTFGRGVVLRHPKKIFIGDDVVIDDNCVLDAKGTDNRGIVIGDGVFIGRNTILNCQNGDMLIDDGVNIGANCMVFSASEVRIERDNLIAAYAYLVGGTHTYEDPTVPVLHQGRTSRGIRVGPGGWIGAHVTVFDGVSIGRNAVIAAGSTVHRKIPDYAVAGGNPVTIINNRKGSVEPRVRQPVTVGIVNYNGRDVLKSTLDSVRALDYPTIEEIIVADNRSTDESVDFVRENYPEAKIIELDENRGPNPARNEVLKAAKSSLVLLMDNDIILNPDVVSHLEEAFDRDPNIGIAGAQIRFHDKPEKIQFNGAHIHFAGEAVQNRIEWGKSVEVGAVPAGTILVSREKAVEIGGFDEDFFYGWADGDFSYRMTISGYPCVMVPDAQVFHMKEAKGLSWVKYQVRNRWWFILKTYHLRTLVVLFPAILLYQLGIFGFLTIKGHLGGFIRGSLSAIGTLPQVLKKRKAVMRMKKVRDKDVLVGSGAALLGESDGSAIFRIIYGFFSACFGLYWAVAKHFVK